jgi:hypothetical protein
MTTEEARRHDLYNAVIEVFGEDNAETLMALLPAHEGIDLATRDDLVGMSDAVGSRMNRLEDRFDRLEDRFDRLETRFDGLETRMNQRFDAVNQRLDRLFLTLAAGLIAMIATVFAQALL